VDRLLAGSSRYGWGSIRATLLSTLGEDCGSPIQKDDEASILSLAATSP
jgi:hypothetical protein